MLWVKIVGEGVWVVKGSVVFVVVVRRTEQCKDISLVVKGKCEIM